MVMDLLNGGDLRFHIGKRKRFNEAQTKFMIACMVIGLEYMHNEKVIHRDIKPENIVMEDNGYLRITDMGIARKKHFFWITHGTIQALLATWRQRLCVVRTTPTGSIILHSASSAMNS